METRFHVDTDREKYVGKLRQTADQITAINEEQEKRSRFHYNRAQNLTVCYLFFQIIIFASLTTSSTSSLRCQQQWIPLMLSAIPAILFFAVLWDALTSYHQIQKQIDMYYIEQQRIRGLIYDAENKTDAILTVDHDHVMKPDGFVVFKRLVCIWTVVLALVGFTAVVLCSSRLILCRR